MILLVIRWQNTSNIIIIDPIITQLLLPYNSSIYTTALYIIALFLTVDPILSRTLKNIPHHLLSFTMF